MPRSSFPKTLAGKGQPQGDNSKGDKCLVPSKKVGLRLTKVSSMTRSWSQGDIHPRDQCHPHLLAQEGKSHDSSSGGIATRCPFLTKGKYSSLHARSCPPCRSYRPATTPTWWAQDHLANTARPLHAESFVMGSLAGETSRGLSHPLDRRPVGSAQRERKCVKVEPHGALMRVLQWADCHTGPSLHTRLGRQ